MNYKPVVARNQSNGNAGTKACDDAGKAKMETVPGKDYILLPFDHGKKVDEVPRQDSKGIDQEKLDEVNSTNNVNATGTNRVNADENDGEEAYMNNLDTSIQVSLTPTTRISKDHPLDQLIGDVQSDIQTKNMSKNLEEHGFVTTIHQRTNRKDLQNCLFTCFLSQEEPKKLKKEMGEGSANLNDPHHTPTIIQPSTSQPKKPKQHRKSRRKVTEVPHPSDPTEHVADEAVNEEMDDSLQHLMSQAPKGLIQVVVSGFNTPRSGEDSLKLNELMEICSKLQQRVLDLETRKTNQAMEIESLKRRVKKIERRKRSSTYKLQRLYKGRIAHIDANENIYLVNVHNDKDMFGVDHLDGDEVFVKSEDVADQAKEVVADKDIIDDITLAKALIERAKPKDDKVKDKGKAIMVEPDMPIKKKDQINLDEEW
nr:hypothetical protein [Tanacetum cinerariifolium]